MESDPRNDLREVDRLASEARRASFEIPPAVIAVVLVTELGFLTVYAATNWSLPWPVVGAWFMFLFATLALVRMRRRVKPPSPWSTPETRRLAVLNGVFTVAANALFIPLWMLNRWLAVGVLMAVLAFALTRQFRSAPAR